VARKAFEEEIECKYYECSALTRTGVVELFEGSVRDALARRHSR
jgi:GTPase SAR1 family protein